ncbi:hypothetical protein [Streptomyces sp. NPDC014733]|uniref:hypothetical protein n=1 Tax=Streptomyces sp. NPDC014733 TaxID=3364885 RepID=UPI0036F761B4
MTERQQERTAEGGVPTRIGQAVMLHRAGDREEARNRLLALWHELGPSADPLHRCTLAHYLAATQDTPQARLTWDLTALEAAEGFVTTGRTRTPEGGRDEPCTGPYGGEGTGPSGAAGATGKADGPGHGGAPGGGAPGGGDEPRAARTPERAWAALRALFPALHLSLVADYTALGRPGDARTHLLRARTWAAALPDGAHRQTLYADIDRLGARLDGGPGRG